MVRNFLVFSLQMHNFRLASRGRNWRTIEKGKVKSGNDILYAAGVDLSRIPSETKAPTLNQPRTKQESSWLSNRIFHIYQKHFTKTLQP